MKSCKATGSCGAWRRLPTVLFFNALVYLVLFPVLTSYWQRDNNGPLLAPDSEFRFTWISDADFRKLETTDQPVITSEVDGKTWAAGAAWKRIRPYYVATPDGKWHVAVMARGTMTTYALRAVLGAVVPPVILCVVGLAVCLCARSAGSVKTEPVEALP